MILSQIKPNPKRKRKGGMTLTELFGDMVSNYATRANYSHEWTDRAGKKFARFKWFLSAPQAKFLRDLADKEGLLTTREYKPGRYEHLITGLNVDIDNFISTRGKEINLLTWRSQRDPLEIGFLEGLDEA